MKPKTTLILLIIAVLIGGFVWYDTQYLKDTGESEKQSKRVFRDLKSSEITRFELHNTNGVVVTEKSGDKWEMKQPYQVRASKSEIDSILDGLEFLNFERILSPKDLKEANATPGTYGLDKPRVEATITVGGKLQTLKLGEAGKIGDSLYAMVSGRESVYAINKSLLDRLNKKVDDLRDRTVIEFLPGQLTKLELKAGNRQIELTKVENAEDAKESWRITRPLSARADKTKINDMANKLSDLKVETFVTEDPKDLKPYGLDEPPQEVTLFTKGSEGGKIVQFGSSPTNDATKVYARRKAANSIYLVKHDILTNLVLQVNDLRDRKLAEFETDQVNAISLNIGGQNIALAHHTNEWTFVGMAKLKPEQSACEDLVQRLRDAEIKEFVADAPADLTQYGLEKPTYEITLQKEKIVSVVTTNQPPTTAEAGKPGSTNAVATVGTTMTTNLISLVTIQVGKTDGAKGIVYAKRTDEPFVYGVGTNLVAGLPKSVLDLRDRTILQLEPVTIQRLEITRGGSLFATQRIKLKETNGVERAEWKLVTPAQGILASDAVEDAVFALADLKAGKLIEENPANLSQFGLEQPALVATFVSIVAANAPAQTHTVLVGAESPEKHHFAMIKGNPLVFELEDDTYARMTKDFVTKPEEKPAAGATNAPPAATTQPQAATTNQPAAQTTPSAPSAK